MTLLRALGLATATELSVLGAAAGLASLGGTFNGWLDIVAQFAPWWLAIALVGGLLGLVSADETRSRTVILSLAAVGVLSCGVLIVPELAHAVIAGLKARP